MKIQALKDTKLFKKQNRSKVHPVREGKQYQVDKVLDFFSSDQGACIEVSLGFSAGIWSLYSNDWTTLSNGKTLGEDELVVKELEPRVKPSRNLVYFNQRDNTKDPHRTCFSSTCAMLLKFYQPFSIKSDDDYITEVFKRGDTTNANVQLQTLRGAYGLECEFSQNKTIDWLRYMVTGTKDVVACGILHHGPIVEPRGHGHWCLVTNYNVKTNKFTVLDPYMKPDYIDGGFSNQSGNGYEIDARIFEQRWAVEGGASGWCLYRI